MDAINKLLIEYFDSFENKIKNKRVNDLKNKN